MFSALVIHDLAATIERLHQPKLAGRPLVIVCGEHQLKVLATDERAREAGVSPGGSRKQAELHCPEATLLRARDEVYRRLFADVSADLAQHIDKVEPSYQPGRAWWIVATDHPSELNILRQRIACLLGGSVSIGTASGKFVAQVAGGGGAEHCRVARGDEAAFLAPFPAPLLRQLKEREAGCLILLLGDDESNTHELRLRPNMPLRRLAQFEKQCRYCWNSQPIPRASQN